MKLKKIIITTNKGDILYKVACHIYNINIFPLEGLKIEILDENKAVVYYKPFKVKMRRD